MLKYSNFYENPSRAYDGTFVYGKCYRNGMAIKNEFTWRGLAAVMWIMELKW